MPTSESTVAEPVRCRGCKRIIGYAKSHHDGVFCTLAMCATTTPATLNEDRDSAFVEVVRVLGKEVAPTAEELGITRQRAYQILRERSAA